MSHFIAIRDFSGTDQPQHMNFMGNNKINHDKIDQIGKDTAGLKDTTQHIHVYTSTLTTKQFLGG